MSAKKGINLFGQKAIDALSAEWRQLDACRVLKGRHFDSLTHEQRRKALRAVQLIKQKKDDRIKGRTCANGRNQRDYIPDDESSSPTVSTEALLITCTFDALKQRCVVTCDITDAFLYADMDNFTLLVLDANGIEALLQANPSYEEYMHHDGHGNPVMYLDLVKAIYRCVKSARLFWEHLTKTLKKIGFKVNPYDLCVANKTVKGSQCAVTWHVNDLKISHEDEAVVRKVINELEKSTEN